MLRPIEAVTVLTHDRGERPCKREAMHATASWLGSWNKHELQVACEGCGRSLLPDDVTGGPAKTPRYRRP